MPNVSIKDVFRYLKTKDGELKLQIRISHFKQGSRGHQGEITYEWVDIPIIEE